ncbi:MAG: TlpA family protein disulfide reductase [Candidatus Eisenbacteria bacterium]|uniref:TlpA family protein disulfide reductase n=1 Tax=Eiseniibacteriota bacterium TaxID=2212470 RepID=A0A849SRF4_UNCEI|nr:TlpA family protein disulfide reductase [Candidatus Eisenbacteria bacterium]
MNAIATRRISRRGAALAALAAILLGFAPAPAPAGAPVAAHTVAWRGSTEALRRHPLRGLDGRTVTLASLQGEVVVVNFWASWCRPCARELPALDALNTELAASGGRVIAVSIDTDLENARRFATAHHLKMPLYHDGPKGLAPRIGLEAIPFTVVLDRDGAVQFATRGSDAGAVQALVAEARRLAVSRPYLSATPQGGTR